MSSLNSVVGALRANLSLETAEFVAGASKAQSISGNIKNSLGQVDGAADKASKAFNKTGKAAVGYSNQMRGAAGANANLVSQFNDIAVMMAAGQNPLQLAMQQGTQISQVLTQMGGGMGALRALGSAFIGMLNPISLATIGVIGFGAAAVQWLMPAKKEAEKAKDAFEALKESMDSYKEAMGVNLMYTGEAEKIYGAEARRGAELAGRQMEAEAQKTQQSVRRILSEAYSSLNIKADDGLDGINANRALATSLRAEAASAMGFDDSSWSEYGGVKAADRELAYDYLQVLRQIHEYASSPASLDGGMQGYQEGLAERLNIAQQLLDKAVEQGAAEAVIEQHRERLRNLEIDALKYANDLQAVKEADNAKAQELLTNYEHQAKMAELIKKHGEDSLIVRIEELNAEHRKQEAAIDGLNIAEETKDALQAAADANYDAEVAGHRFANAMAGVKAEIAGIINLLAQIGGGIMANAEKFTTAKLIREGMSRYEAEKTVRYAREDRELAAAQAANVDQWGIAGKVINHALQLAHDGNRTGAEELEAAYKLDEERTKAQREAEREAAKGGRKKATTKLTEAERDAKRDAKQQAEAYEKLQEQLTLLQGGLGQTALQQRILSESQKIGTAATFEEVAAMVTKMDQLERVQDGINEFRDGFRSAFTDLVTGARSASEVLSGILSNLASRFADFAANSFFDSILLPMVAGAFGGGGGVTGNVALSSALRAIPGFAGGVTNFSGGYAVVGEKGPEILSMGRGSNVITNENVNKMLSGSQAAPAIHVSVDEGLRVQLLNDSAKQSAHISQSAISEYRRNGFAVDARRMSGSRSTVTG